MSICPFTEVGLCADAENLLSRISSSQFSLNHDGRRFGLRPNAIMSTPDAIPGASAAASGQATDIHPLVHNALRASLSTREYRVLHDVAVKRAPALKSKLPSPSQYESVSNPKNRHNEAALRTSLRVLVGSGLALKLLELVMSRVQPDPNKYEHE